MQIDETHMGYIRQRLRALPAGLCLTGDRHKCPRGLEEKDKLTHRICGCILVPLFS